MFKELDFEVKKRTLSFLESVFYSPQVQKVAVKGRHPCGFCDNYIADTIAEKVLHMLIVHKPYVYNEELGIGMVPRMCSFHRDAKAKDDLAELRDVMIKDVVDFAAMLKKP